jgi:hypothetical protein
MGDGGEAILKINRSSTSKTTTMKTISVFFCSLILAALAHGQIIHVPSDQPTIQAGINAAISGDTVLVAPGTYFENINFMGKAITVASHYLTTGDTAFIYVTTIDGSQPVNPDFASTVCFMTAEDTTSVICGFTITGGAGMVDPVYSARIGGGILCYYATARILHNRIINNTLTADNYAWGAGICSFMESGYYWMVIENNIISGNQCITSAGNATGGGVEVDCNARVSGNVISNNHCTSSTGDAAGGGLFNYSSNTPADSLFLMDNLICDNTVTAATTSYGGGVSVSYSHCMVFGNIIRNNTLTSYGARGGGLFFRETGFLHLKGNTLSYNAVYPSNNYFGVAIQCAFPAGEVIIHQNEFSYNEGPLNITGGGVGGGISVWDAITQKVSVQNNLFFSNKVRFGGGYYSRSSYNVEVSNNIFNSNNSYVGGAFGIYHPSVELIGGKPAPAPENVRPVFVNNTFINNSASARGGATQLNCEITPPILFNNIFWGNTCPDGKDIRCITGSIIVVDHCDIDTNEIVGIWTGQGNFYADPQLIPDDTLSHLNLLSPCINSGCQVLEVDGIEYFPPTSDFDGEGRPDPVSMCCDVGADEYWGTPAAPVALDPEIIGSDYFMATWKTSLLAMGYSLDVALDESFTQIIPGYDNLDVGADTTAIVSGLESLSYYYRVRAYNAMFTSPHSNTIVVLGVGISHREVHSPEFRVWNAPNPFKDATNVQFYLPESAQVIISVFDLTGKTLDQFDLGNLSSGINSYQINASEWPGGVCFLRLTAVSGTGNAQHYTVTRKVMVLR